MYPSANLFTSVFLTLQYNLLHPMSKLGLVIVLILMAGRIFAQDYFVLIEADNGQPFYVRVDSQLYSSSAKGHLILSHLKDSSYIITIGFPGQVFPERQFSFNVHQNDHAFRLKNVEGKGWWLMDDKGQELASLNSSGGGASARIPGIKKDDAFSRLMSDLVKDTAVMYTTFTITPASGTPTNIASVNTTPAKDSQALTNKQPADTTASTSHLTHDSAAISVIRSTHDSSTATRPITNSVDSGVVRSTAVPTSTAATPPASDSTTATHTASTPLYRPIPRKDTATTSTPLASAAPPASTSVTPSSAALPPTSAVVPLPSASNPLYRTRTTGVTMLTEHRSTRSLRQVYADHDSTGKSDTVVIIIPLDTPAQTGHPAVVPFAPRVSHTASADSSHPADSSHSTDGHHPAIPQGHGTKADSIQPTLSHSHGANPDTASLSATRTSGKSTLPFVNSDCHNFATDYDVDKLRVKMLESAKDDDRILAARKVFKTKCFSTRQIRALSEVFTTDASKFKFLEAAYPFVSDDHFAELSSLLADPVYSGRFRAMTNH
jgi:Domain of unknown function (DUF4476)